MSLPSSHLVHLASVALAVGLLLALPAARAMLPAGASAAAPAAVPTTDRLIVRYRNATQARTLDAPTLAAARVAGNRQGVQMTYLKPTAEGAHVLRLNRKLTLDEVRGIAQDLKAADANVDYAEPDRILTIQLAPNDPAYVTDQWHYKAATVEPGGLNLPAAWDKSTGAGVVVAVIDTGYRPHADLAGNIVGGYDFIGDTATASDGGGRDSSALDPGDATAAGECGSGAAARNSSWHGTHVAGTIAALTNNASGVAGVAFSAQVLPVRVLGKCGGYTSDIAAGIIWASGGSVTGVPANPNAARVINLSLGGSGSCDQTSQNAINSARSRGTVVVVSAGNSNANAANFSPASCAGVISVAAVGRSGGKAYYSNFGSTVDVAAPGGDTSTGTANGVYSTLNTGTGAPGADSYAYYQGTSMAAPHVAGTVALMLAKNAALTPDDVEARLKASARAFPAGCSQCGSGIVDASAAVDAAAGGVTPVPQPTVVAETGGNNNTISGAQLVTPDYALVNGSISKTSDGNDYYRVTLAVGKTEVATLTPGSSTLNVDLSAYDSAGTRVVVSSNGAGMADTVSVTNSGASAVTIYLRVARIAGLGAYSLTLKQ